MVKGTGTSRKRKKCFFFGVASCPNDFTASSVVIEFKIGQFVHQIFKRSAAVLMNGGSEQLRLSLHVLLLNDAAVVTNITLMPRLPAILIDDAQELKTNYPMSFCQFDEAQRKSDQLFLFNHSLDSTAFSVNPCPCLQVPPQSVFPRKGICSYHMGEKSS